MDVLTQLPIQTRPVTSLNLLAERATPWAPAPLLVKPFLYAAAVVVLV